MVAKRKKIVRRKITTRKIVRKVARKTTRRCKGGWLSLDSGISYEPPLRSDISEGKLVQKRKKSAFQKAKQLARIATARANKGEQKRAEQREARRVAEIKRLGRIEELNVARARANMAVKKARTTSPLNFSFSTGKNKKKITWI